MISFFFQRWLKHLKEKKKNQTNRKTLDTAACRAQINDDTHSSFVNNIFVDPDQSIYRSLSGGNKQNHEPQMQT